MDFIEMVGDTIAETGKEVADKAKKLAEIAKLKSRIGTCEEVIRENYLEIGKMYYEDYWKAAGREKKSTKRIPHKKRRMLLVRFMKSSVVPSVMQEGV